MKETLTRILVGIGMAMVGIGAGVLEYFHIPGMRILAMIVVVGMIAEVTAALVKGTRNKEKGIRQKEIKNFAFKSFLFLIPYSLFLIAAAWHVGGRPWIVLLLLLIIVSADVGAFVFGRLIGGDKMWPAISPGKTWAGQIAGIICGTAAALLYGFIGTSVATGHLVYGTFMPQLMWIGMSVALLSQYGDLTESWLKRKLGIKDMSHLLPGHGGIADRFDGWIYVLPVVWLVML